MNYAMADTPTPAGLLREEPYLDAGRSGTEDPKAIIFSKIRELRAHYHEPVSRSQGVTVAERFGRLSWEWKSSVKYLSSMNEIVLHPAYQKIIGMGNDVLPFILRELEESLHHWFWALRSITGVDPVPPESRGMPKEMARAWLEWAKGQGIRW